jgi:Rod binding domain-containing protein
MVDPFVTIRPPVPNSVPDGPVARAAASGQTALEDAAHAFEAAFLAEMLRNAGLGDTPEAMGGGPGEAQFAGLLVDAQARQMVRAGGIGLAEYLVTELRRGSDA